MTEETDYIPRKLSRNDQQQDQHTVGDIHIAAQFMPPLVILTEPGMGKAELMKRLGSQDECYFIRRVVGFLRESESAKFAGKALVIDGLE